MILKKILNMVLFPNTYSNEAYISWLRKNGATIGENTRFIAPKECHVDINRAMYIQIGNNCCLSYPTILAHDYSWYIFKDAMDDILPDPGGKVIIGNNCFIGYKAIILKDTTIGDNVIIGAGAVVKGNVPSNTVWAGIPARQICTLEELYEKKKRTRIDDCIKRAKTLQDHSTLTQENMEFFGLMFLERTEDNYDKYIRKLSFNGIIEDIGIRNYFFKTRPFWDGWNDFLNKNELD